MIVGGSFILHTRRTNVDRQPELFLWTQKNSKRRGRIFSFFFIFWLTKPKFFFFFQFSHIITSLIWSQDMMMMIVVVLVCGSVAGVCNMINQFWPVCVCDTPTSYLFVFRTTKKCPKKYLIFLIEKRKKISVSHLIPIETHIEKERPLKGNFIKP